MSLYPAQALSALRRYGPPILISALGVPSASSAIDVIPLRVLRVSVVLMLRNGQQCRVARACLRRQIGDDRAAARVGRRPEPGRGVLAEEREVSGMHPVADRERAAGVVAVR